MADAMRTHYRIKRKRNIYYIIGSISVLIFCIAFGLYFGCVTSSTLPQQSTTLQLLVIVFRHGDRTPTETYPNDPYKNYNWPNGWGSLTKKGKLEMYKLGEKLSGRYSNFLNENFSSNNVYVKSSDNDRCHMSAGTFLAGLLPPKSELSIWNPHLLWQPIPIHALPRNLDNIIAMKKKCPSYEAALKDAYQSEEIQHFNRMHTNTFRILSDETGQNVTNITAVEFLYNTLQIEHEHGLILPNWTRNLYPTIMKTIAARSLSIFTETPFMRRMKGGVLLKEIIENIKNPGNRKLFLYSSHDITLVNLLRTIGFVEDMKPDYGATLIIQVHNDFHLEMLYYNSSSSGTEEPHKLTLESCGVPCNLQHFTDIVAPMLPNDWEKECQL